MKQIEEQVGRSPEVQELLEKKTGFLLSHGNWLLIVFIVLGILVSKELKYPIYQSYDLSYRSKEPNANTLPNILITIPVSDVIKYKIIEKKTAIFLDKDGRILEVGRLGNQINLNNNELTYQVIVSDQSLLSNYDSGKSSKKVLLIIGSTSLFDQFFSQFKTNISSMDNY